MRLFVLAVLTWYFTYVGALTQLQDSNLAVDSVLRTHHFANSPVPQIAQSVFWVTNKGIYRVRGVCFCDKKQVLINPFRQVPQMVHLRTAPLP